MSSYLSLSDYVFKLSCFSNSPVNLSLLMFPFNIFVPVFTPGSLSIGMFLDYLIINSESLPKIDSVTTIDLDTVLELICQIESGSFVDSTNFKLKQIISYLKNTPNHTDKKDQNLFLIN